MHFYKLYKLQLSYFRSPFCIDGNSMEFFTRTVKLEMSIFGLSLLYIHRRVMLAWNTLHVSITTYDRPWGGGGEGTHRSPVPSLDIVIDPVITTTIPRWISSEGDYTWILGRTSGVVAFLYYSMCWRVFMYYCCYKPLAWMYGWRE